MMNKEQHNPPVSAAHTDPFQGRVQPWMMACFGAEISADGAERNHRFLEESLELVQACGCTASEAYQLVDYVYGRPVGERAQEVGGVMVTLAALCLAQGLDMHTAGETELARIWTKVEAIRAKQAAKPKHSPLPAAAPQVVADERAAFEASEPGMNLARDEDGEYENPCVASAWAGYQAGRAAALAQADDSPELTDAEIDAVWKGLNGDTEWLRTFGYQQFARAILAAAQVQPVAVPDGFGKAFVTLESNGGRYSIVMKFNQRSDAFAVHGFLLDAGGKDYNSAAPAAQGDAVSDTGLPELREHLKIASVYGSAVTLSSAAAAALYHAMTTGKPQGDAKATS